MKNIFKNLLDNKPLLLIFIIGLTLRILNPFFGSPTLYVSGDEPPNYMGALYMMENKTPFITSSIYPPLGSYIQIPFLLLVFSIMLLSGKIHNIAELKLIVITNQGYFLFVPRLISGVLGSLTIILVYKTAQLLYPKNRLIAFISAF